MSGEKNVFFVLPNYVLSEGVEPVGNVVMKKTVFTVETISAGMGEVLVYVEDPAGHREEVKLLLNIYLCLCGRLKALCHL